MTVDEFFRQEKINKGNLSQLKMEMQKRIRKRTPMLLKSVVKHEQTQAKILAQRS